MQIAQYISTRVYVKIADVTGYGEASFLIGLVGNRRYIMTICYSRKT